MIYIYRILWLIFYIPVFIIELISFIIGIPLYIIMGLITFIYCGDIEETPDWSIPGRLAVLLDYLYKRLLYKFEK